MPCFARYKHSLFILHDNVQIAHYMPRYVILHLPRRIERGHYLVAWSVLDASTGKPAPGVPIRLQKLAVSEHGNSDVFHSLAKGITNQDGRCLDLLPPRGSPKEETEKTALIANQTYKIIFKADEYFAATNRTCFYPWVEIAFKIEDPAEHYHIPLLISPYSFTTYRGS